MRRLCAWGALLAAAFVALIALAGPASAHATLVTSTPSDGSRLSSAPTSVSLTFDEPVSISYVHVTNPDGKRVESGTASHPGGDGTKISVALSSGLGDGTYVVSYRIISADSHPVAGVVRFVVGNGALDLAVGGGGSTVNHITSAVFDAVRWVSFAGLAVLGGGWLLLTVWPQGRDDVRARRLIGLGWTAATLGTLAELLIQGPYAAGDGLGGVFHGTLLDDTLHTDYGRYHNVRLLLLGALAVLLVGLFTRELGRWRHLAWPLLVALPVTFSMIGHPDTTNPRWLSIPLDVAHLCAMAAWVGGLTMLLYAVLPTLRERSPAPGPDDDDPPAPSRRGTVAVAARPVAAAADPEVDAIGRRVLPVFSRVAFTSVVVLAGSGTYAAWRGIDSWGAVFGTTYGLLVVTKVALFVLLLAVGNLGRRAIARHRTGGPLTLERIRRGVVVEVALAAVVLVATAVLVSEPRGPEALATEHRAPVTATAPLSQDRTATVTVDPGVHGSVTITVALSPGPTASAVTGTAALPSQQLGPLPLKFAAAGGGSYAVSGVQLPAAGRWVITLTVTYGAFNSTVTDVTVRLY